MAASTIDRIQMLANEHTATATFLDPFTSFAHGTSPDAMTILPPSLLALPITIANLLANHPTPTTTAGCLPTSFRENAV
jgi:hypothetical protein